MKLTIVAAIQLFASGAVFAGWLDMQVVKELRIHSPRFGSEAFANYNMKRAARFVPLKYLLGKKTIEFMKTRTFLFPFVELVFASLVVLSAYIHGLGGRWIADCMCFCFAVPLSMISWSDDYDTRVAPDEITISGTIVGIVASVIPGSFPQSRADNVLSAVDLLTAPTSLLHRHIPRGAGEVLTSLKPSSLGFINSISGSIVAGGLLFLVAEGYFRIRRREGLGLG